MKRLLVPAIALFTAACYMNKAPLARRQELPKQYIAFYSDLGPNAVDVSSYPAEQQRNYAVYARVCSQCHSLARSINAPTVSREFWSFYVAGMRLRTAYRPASISDAEAKAALDFLEFDSAARKTTEKGFDRQTAELKRRYDAYLEDYVRRLQQTDQPKLIPNADLP